MKIEIINKTISEEMALIPYVNPYAPELKLTPGDIDLFIRKCIRDGNFSILNIPSVTIKFLASLSVFVIFQSSGFFPYLYTIDLDNVSFSLSEKFENNDKIQTYLASIIKKTSILKDSNLKKEDFLQFIPLSTNVSFFMSETLNSWMRLITFKYYNNCTKDMKDVISLIEKELMKFYPSIINEKTLKLYAVNNPRL